MPRGTLVGSSVASNLTEDQWVCQMEGIMLKRGGGYKGDEDKSDGNKSGAIASFKKFLKSRRGTFLIKKGSAEKKRYFELLTLAADQDKPPKAELRYYSKTKPEGAPKGTVLLNTKMRVELTNHSTVLLITPSRTYYLRPLMKGEEDASSAKARVTAGKWIHALEFAIEGLKAFALAGTYDTSRMMNPVMRMSVNISPEAMAKARERLLSAAKNAEEGDAAEPPLAPSESNKSTKKEGAAAAAPLSGTPLRKALQENQEGFAELWDEFGIHGYNLLLAHFGPVQIELKRLEDHLKIRCKLVDSEVCEFDKNMHKSHDVATSEQETSARMLDYLYGSIKRRAGKTKEHLQGMEKKVLEPVQELIKSVDDELEKIVKQHAGTTKSIERLLQSHQDLYENIIELKTQIKRQQDLKLLADSGIGSAKQYKEGELEELQSDLDTTQGMLVQCKEALRNEEKKHANHMKAALRALQALEVRRLDAQKNALYALFQLESQMFSTAQRFFSEDEQLFRAINAVDPAADVAETSERLLKDAKLFKV